ncbi:hypothetical protein PCASD_06800 [Puccinia coronata f. sp. avenae]|uniref:Ricin B lectin domain-containing protein n=1 Tax=Puccinia coronata f. sp. avenae TaxID=200324 RepID=A0A2N5UQF0_9BASI|nr:hypothetical protein PCASD_06800 [Puccinia coronata f. sp. avenae]
MKITGFTIIITLFGVLSSITATKTRIAAVNWVDQEPSILRGHPMSKQEFSPANGGTINIGKANSDHHLTVIQDKNKEQIQITTRANQQQTYILAQPAESGRRWFHSTTDQGNVGQSFKIDCNLGLSVYLIVDDRTPLSAGLSQF